MNVIGTALAAALATGLAAVALGTAFPYGRGQSRALRNKLEMHASLPGALRPELLEASRPHTSALTALLARLPFRPALQRLLDRAASRQPVDRALAIIGLCAIGCGGLAGLSGGSAVAGLIGAVLGGAIPVARLKWKAGNRKRRFEEQLPDALDFMSRALRAGHGLTSTFQMVSEEMTAPIADEFRQVFDEINFGIAFQDALGRVPKRIDSSDLDFFVVGVLIQRETGGNLSELLRTLSQTMRERLLLAGKVRILASEGKFSGILLGSLPFAMGLGLTAISPEYTSVLWTTPAGQQLVMIGLGMMALGFAWMWKITQIKV